jgi:hypothetical protein
MFKEEIRIVMERDSCIVYCTFWFKNISAHKDDISMGFPDYFESICSGSQPLRGFTCKVNGEKTDCDKRTQTIQFDSDTSIFNYEKWYCWEVEFNPNETVVIENSYVGSWGGSASGICEFGYLIGTAQTWFGNIGSGKVTFDYSNLASQNFIDTSYYSDDELPDGLHRKIYNDSTVFSYSNYLPEWNETLHVYFICFWGTPFGVYEDDLEVFPFEITNRSNKTKLRLMRNEVYARHGYVFKDLALQNYFLSQLWYKPDNTFDMKKLSRYEFLFVSYLKKLEKDSTN